MSELKWVAGINLAIVLIYSIIFRVVFEGNERQLGILIFSAMAIGVQVLVNIVLSIAYYIGRNNKTGQAYFASAVLVLLLGFSVCMGNAAL